MERKPDYQLFPFNSCHAVPEPRDLAKPPIAHLIASDKRNFYVIVKADLLAFLLL